MKHTEQLIHDLRNEYLTIQQKIATASFALDTLPLDKKERSLLNDQIDAMCEYGAKVKERARYAAEKARPMTDPKQGE